MHDDLLDAVAWVVEQGYADRARVGDLRRLLRRLRRARRRDVLAGRLPLRVDVVGPSEPAHADRRRSRRTGRRSSPSSTAGRQPRDRVRPPVVALAALARRRHPHPAADRPGGERPAGQEEESDQIVAAMPSAGSRTRYLVFEDEGHGFRSPRTHGVPGRGRAVPRRAPGRALRAVTPRALHIMNESSGPARVFVEALEERGFEIVTVTPARRPAAGLSRGVRGDPVRRRHGQHAPDRRASVARSTRSPSCARRIADGVPTIGLCLGAQLLTEAAGGDGLPLRAARGRLVRGRDRARRRLRSGAGRPAAAVHGDAVAPLRLRAAVRRPSSWPETPSASRPSGSARPPGARSSTSRSRATSCESWADMAPEELAAVRL